MYVDGIGKPWCIDPSIRATADVERVTPKLGPIPIELYHKGEGITLEGVVIVNIVKYSVSVRKSHASRVIKEEQTRIFAPRPIEIGQCESACFSLVGIERAQAIEGEIDRSTTGASIEEDHNWISLGAALRLYEEVMEVLCGSNAV
jgi:hypothetical protein